MKVFLTAIVIGHAEGDYAPGKTITNSAHRQMLFFGKGKPTLLMSSRLIDGINLQDPP